MKTPREVLLERHRCIETGLDRIRVEIVSNHLPVLPQIATATWTSRVIAWPFCAGRKLWLELVWPARRVWAGFAFAWLMIVAAYFTDTERAATFKANRKRPAAEMRMVLEQQQRLMAEFTAQMEAPVADDPKRAAPKPRSDLLPMWQVG
jgi:hypothetical protein